jgi:hypothetical protein
MSRAAVRVVLSAILVIALGATAAHAARYVPNYEDPELVFSEQAVWFHNAVSPAGNVDAANGDLVRWDTTEPTASAPMGAGGAYVANNYSVFTDLIVGGQRESNTFSSAGTFIGNLDSMAVSLFGHMPAGGLCTEMSLAFDLRIDGQTILFQDQGEPSANLATYPAGDLYEVKFVFTRLHEAMELNGIETGPDVEHEIYLNAANFYACNEAVWVYDSSEAPAGIVFNRFDKALGPYTEIDVFNPPPPLAD